MDQHILLLFKKYLHSNLTPDELREVVDFIESGNYLMEWNEVLKADADYVIETGLTEDVSKEEIQRLYGRIKLTAGIEKSDDQYSRFRIWRSIAAVAAMLFLTFTGIYFYNNSSRSNRKSYSYANDIGPGKQGSTLTLANGQKILINEATAGSIADQSGVKISKTAKGEIIYEPTESKSGITEYNTLSTAKGEQTQIRLPDGSIVFLNAASSLKYPTSFARLKNRRVSLTGEGYFEISKNKNHSFIVVTDKQEVEVLGTHFNINAYADESCTKTTLLEGSVKVITLNPPVILKPGQQFILTGNSTEVKQTDPESAIAWKNGNFVFERESIESIMRKVARWYNVEIIYNGERTKEWYSGITKRSSHVSQILSMLEKTGTVNFQIEGNKIIVSKPN